MNKIVITGDRNWDDQELEEKIINLFNNLDPKNTTIIHGACRGVDMVSDRLGRRMGFNIISIEPNWNLYGKRAGPIRNKELLDLGPDIVYAFHKNLDQSKGTKNMITQANKRGIVVIHIS